MTKIMSIIALFLFSTFSLAQNRSAIDSLFQVKSYLLEVKNSVNQEQNQKLKIEQLDKLIKTASKQQAIFNRNLNTIIKNSQELKQLKTSFDLILQSLILFKADIKEKDNISEEIVYLNRNIAILVDKINYYCKIAEIEQQTNTYKN